MGKIHKKEKNIQFGAVVLKLGNDSVFLFI